MSHLLDELAALLRRRDPVPEHVAAAAHAVPELVDGLRRLDGPQAERMELIGDSARPSLNAGEVATSGVRGYDAGETRSLSFRGRGRRVETEIVADTDRTVRVTGMTLDYGEGYSEAVRIHHPGGQRESPVDHLGCFRLAGVPRGPVRLVLLTEQDLSLVSDWLLC